MRFVRSAVGYLVSGFIFWLPVAIVVFVARYILLNLETSLSIVRGRHDGEPRAFGFMEMPAKAQAQAGIAGLNGKKRAGRPSVSMRAVLVLKGDVGAEGPSVATRAWGGVPGEGL